MNEKVTNFIKNTKGYLSKHSPEILTGIGITGMITSTVLAVKATPKALQLLEEAKTGGELYCEKLPVKSVIKIAWKPYLPAAITGALSISCLIGANTINGKRNAALATAYAISERTLVRYRDKVIETIGEKKEKEIKEKIAQDEVNKKAGSNAPVIITSKGNTLCMDSISGRVFRSDLDIIRKAVNELNRRMLNQNYISLDEFYSAIGLESTKTSSRLGWNIDKGFIELDFDTCLVEDEPCVYIDYSIAPIYDFDMMA